MKYRKWYYDGVRHVFLLDISPPSGDIYGVCYGWMIHKLSSSVTFGNTYGHPHEWNNAVRESEPDLKVSDKRKMFFDLFEKVGLE